jgi:gas vesicle protein
MLYGKDDHSAGCIALAFLAGGLLGASIALIAAPQSGRETRRLIKGLVKESMEKPEEYLEDIKCRLSSIVEEAESYIEGIKSKLHPTE